MYVRVSEVGEMKEKIKRAIILNIRLTICSCVCVCVCR